MFTASLLWKSKVITNKNESDNTLLSARHKDRGLSRATFIHTLCTYADSSFAYKNSIKQGNNKKDNSSWLIK